MYKKILGPLDGSKRAEAILPHVGELAHRFDAQIVLLKVVEPISVYSTGGGYVPDLETIRQNHKRIIQGTESYLMGIKGEFREKSISTKSVVDEGPIVRMIIDVADREEVDLVAMASHGRTGLSHVFYGSVTAGVLHRIDRPLLLIRADDK